jgi:MFS superfamily sulfate permease-like transporter
LHTSVGFLASLICHVNDFATAVMVVSALIFVLGIDLVKEALWDTRHRVSRPEYVTIASIMVAMTVWDFVVGVLFGIVVSCEHLHGGSSS